MSQPADVLSGPTPERKLGGTARLLLGFIIGALFVLVPTYSFYMGREAALRGDGGAHDQPLALAVEPRGVTVEPVSASGGSKPFASRLTYELSRAPEERPAIAAKPVPARAAAPTASVARAAKAPLPAPAAALSETSPSAERVANAKPISSVPPDPRDRTAEIEKEAQNVEYREAPRRPSTPALATAPRVFEGRAIELKPAPKAPDAASRTTAANGSPAPRPEPEAERIAGVTPIKPPAKAAAATVVAKAPGSAAGTRAARTEDAPAGAAPAPSGDVQARLDVTRGWLASSPPTLHTIQLMGTNSEEQLKAHLKSLAKVIEPSKVYLFRTKAQGKPSITVVYGAYADRRSALDALEKLPPALAANKPVLRTVNGIRAEMKQHNTDG
jgi:septal ring-binding cell division protein DamX